MTALLGLAGCAVWRPTPVPLRTLAEPAACGRRVDTLIVMLPGSYSLPEDFRTEGFVDAVRRRDIAADLLLVDAHLGYYAERSIVERLKADVLAPARRQGYTHLWLMGISIGAFGAVITADDDPEGIDGLALLGPYLGSRIASNEIAAAGGLRRWHGPAGELAPEEIDARLWRWLQGASAGAMRGRAPDLALGYGRSDRFASSDRLLAAALPAGRVFTADGGHDWPAWREVWADMLDTLPLPRDTACAAPVGDGAAPAAKPASR